MTEKEIQWYKLDNAGKLFPSIATLRCTTVFRVSATLNDLVNPELLQLALNHLAPRMPYYQVNLKRGFFWYYLEKVSKLPQIEKENNYPCIYILFQKKGYFPFRILYFGRKISLEIAHFLTDGTGAILFLKSLLAEYFRLKGIEFDFPEELIHPDQKIEYDEYEDSFKKCYIKTDNKIPQLKPAMHFPFPLTERGKYHIVTGIMPVAKVLERAKKYNVTLTAFFLSLYIEAILDFIKQTPSYIRSNLIKPVTINVPVNLRSIFSSKTMRNFFLSITPSINPDYKDLDFDRILESVSFQMKEGIKKENLAPFIARNVKSETSIFIRLLPLLLKDTIMPLIYLAFGEYLYTSSISNIGKISMPAQLENLIERFEFYPSPSRGNKIKTTMVSFKDKMYFTFGKLTRETIIEKLFFRKIIKSGIPVKIETN